MRKILPFVGLAVLATLFLTTSAGARDAFNRPSIRESFREFARFPDRAMERMTEDLGERIRAEVFSELEKRFSRNFAVPVRDETRDRAQDNDRSPSASDESRDDQTVKEQSDKKDPEEKRSEELKSPKAPSLPQAASPERAPEPSSKIPPRARERDDAKAGEKLPEPIPPSPTTASTTPSIPPPAVPPPQAPLPPAMTLGMVSLNFDDGWRSAYERALPIVSAAGFKASHYPITGPRNFTGYITGQEIQTLAAMGHEIGAHTRTHPDLTAVTTAQAREEIFGSRDDLVALSAMPITFAYPYGRSTEDINNIVREAGFIAARGVNDASLNVPSTDRFDLRSHSIEQTTTFEDVRRQIDQTSSEGGWYIMVFHEIDTDDQFSASSELVRMIVEYLRDKNVRVVTNAEGVRLLGGQ